MNFAIYFHGQAELKIFYYFLFNWRELLITVWYDIFSHHFIKRLSLQRGGNSLLASELVSLLSTYFFKNSNVVAKIKFAVIHQTKYKFYGLIYWNFLCDTLFLSVRYIIHVLKIDIVALQVLGLGLGVDFVFPLSQEHGQEQQEQEQQKEQQPPPKFLERNSTRG